MYSVARERFVSTAQVFSLFMIRDKSGSIAGYGIGRSSMSDYYSSDWGSILKL